MFDGRVALDSQRELMETNQSRLLIRHYTQSGSWPTSEDMIGALGYYIKDYKGANLLEGLDWYQQNSGSIHHNHYALGLPSLNTSNRAITSDGTNIF